MALRNKNRVVRQLAQNDLIINNKGAFTWGPALGWKPQFDAMHNYANFIVAYRDGKNAQQCFELTGYTADGWADRYSQYFED